MANRSISAFALDLSFPALPGVAIGFTVNVTRLAPILASEPEPLERVLRKKVDVQSVLREGDGQ